MIDVKQLKTDQAANMKTRVLIPKNKKFFSTIAGSLLAACFFTANAHSQSLEPTKIIMFRHAPKNLDESSNDSLSPEGKKRAQAFTQLASLYNIKAIYSSSAARALQTVAPLSKKTSLEVDSSISPFDYSTLIETIENKHSGSTVVLVGHSNTIPSFINFLVPDANLKTIPENNYDDIFIVNYDIDSHTSKLSKLSYKVETEVSYKLLLSEN